MPIIPDPFTHPEIWEKLVLIAPGVAGNGRLIIPGVLNIDVKGGIRESRQDAPGENGARAKYLGWRDAEITINVTVHSKLEFDALQTVLSSLITPRGRRDRPKVCDAAHPQLALFGVRSIYVTDFTARDFQPLEGFGLSISAREFTEEAFKVTKVVTNGKDGKNGKGSKGGKDSKTGGIAQITKPASGNNPNKPKKPAAPAGPAAAAKADPSKFAKGVAAGSAAAKALLGK
jgi:hypothetical protein